MNDRLHRMAEYTQQQAIRQTGEILARKARIPACSHIEVAMVWTVPDKGRRDDENPVATLKPFCDGLVDAGVVPDDTAEYMTKLMPRIEYRKGEKGVRFEIRADDSDHDAVSRRPTHSQADAQSTTRESHQCDSPEALRRSGGDAA